MDTSQFHSFYFQSRSLRAALFLEMSGPYGYLRADILRCHASLFHHCASIRATTVGAGAARRSPKCSSATCSTWTGQRGRAAAQSSTTWLGGVRRSSRRPMRRLQSSHMEDGVMGKDGIKGKRFHPDNLLRALYCKAIPCLERAAAPAAGRCDQGRPRARRNELREREVARWQSLLSALQLALRRYPRPGRLARLRDGRQRRARHLIPDR